MSGNKVTDALAGVLADSCLLFAKTQNYHWNVTGPQFFSLHELFSVQYNELFLAIDEIAERIRQLGEHAPGTLAEFLRLTVISEEESVSTAGMVADLAASNSRAAERVQACLALAADVADDGTVDLMTRRLAAHSKAEWMLRATLGDQPESAAVPTVAAVAQPKVPAKPKAPKPKKQKRAPTPSVTAASKPAGKKRSRQAVG